MNNNYEIVFADDVDIGQAIDFIDVEDMAQHIYFGPQAEIMESLNRFNQNYQGNLSITKTFRWSPGTYDKVAELMMRKVGLRRRASGMYNYLTREDYWWGPGRDRIKRELRTMDTTISSLRYDGVVWLDDPSVLIERKNIFKNYVCEKFEQFLDICNKQDKISVLNVLLESDGSATLRSIKLTINIVLHPGEIQVYNVTGSNSNTIIEPTHIQNIPMDMDLLLKLEFYPLQDIAHNSSYDRPRFTVHSKGQAAAHDERGRLHFPYISSSYGYGRTEGLYSVMCYGDDATDINHALRKFELPAYALLLMNWMNRYTQHTNPYNNIKKSYHGEPKWLTDAYRTIFGTNRWEDCQYSPSGDDDYCDTNECALRYTCEMYKTAHHDPATREQAEQLTIQWATRMGGVGANAAPTITHSVNNEGEPTSTTNDLVETPIQGDREQDHDAVMETIRQAEETRINAEMDADEARQEALIQGLRSRDESEEAADNIAEERGNDE